MSSASPRLRVKTVFLLSLFVPCRSHARIKLPLARVEARVAVPARAAARPLGRGKLRPIRGCDRRPAFQQCGAAAKDHARRAGETPIRGRAHATSCAGTSPSAECRPRNSALLRPARPLEGGGWQMPASGISPFHFTPIFVSGSACSQALDARRHRAILQATGRMGEIACASSTN